MVMTRDLNVPGGGKMQGWAHVHRLLQNFPRHTSNIGKKMALKAARIYRDDLRKFVMKYEGGPPRSPATILIHGMQRRRVGPLRDSGSYVKLLRLRKVRESKTKVVYSVGAHKQDIHPPSGLPMDVIGRILEFGAPGNLVFGRVPGPIPARPHHRPAFKKFKKVTLPKLVRGWKEDIVREAWRNR